MDDPTRGGEYVAISGDMIRLGQLLKFADVAESGAAAGELIAAGDVSVDGQTETRRGRQLHRGSVVEVATPTGHITLRVT